MKRILSLGTVLVVALSTFRSCSKFDDSKLWEAINKNAKDIAELKELCRQMNSDIKNLQTLVAALENADYITNISPLADGSGYSITMKKYGTIVIKNGENGKDGTNGTNGNNGENGKDGKDGKTPVISVAQDTDGIYYWTINGDWLKDENGNKVKAVGIDGNNGQDGQNGTNGNDGKTPQFDIREGYWYISYDGEHWEKLGKASGDNGLNGEDGDAFFKGVSIGDGFVIFTLNDGADTQIKLPFVTDTLLTVNNDKAGNLKGLLTLEEQRSVTSLKIVGEVNNDDMRFINIYLRSLEELDLSEAIMKYGLYDTPSLNPLKSTAINRTLRHITLGSFMRDDEIADLSIDISYCLALETLVLSTNHACIANSNLSNSNTYSPGWPHSGDVKGAPYLSKLIIAEGVTELKLNPGDAYGAIYCVFPTLDLPSTLGKVHSQLFGLYKKSTIICHAVTPPSIYSSPGYYGSTYYPDPKPTTSFYDAYNQIAEMTLYVPASSVETYKATDGWSKFGSILPIEE